MLASMLITVAAQAMSTVAVTPLDFAASREPQIAISDDGRAYITYGKGNELFVSISSDKGKSYSAPIKVGEAGSLSLGMRRGPRIAVHKSTLTITATYGAQGRGRDGDIVSFRSADKGKTWSKPINVSDVPGSAREGLHGMAISPTGNLACAWLDLRGKGTHLYIATSRNGGSSWSDNRLVYASPSGNICECCHPSLAFDSADNLHVMFRNSLAGARDMYLTSSSDIKTFSTAKKLGQGTWMIAACPMDGGMLTTGPKGSIETIWRREGTIFRSQLAGESSLGDGRNPWITQGASGTYLAWQNGQDIILTSPGSNPRRVSQRGSDPVLAASANGKLVIAAWNENGIRALVVSEN